MVTEPPKLPSVGDVVAGRYRVARVIAEGGMGVVFEVVHRRLDQRFAMKVLYPHYSCDPELRARFDLEGRIAAKLEGPNVAKVIDIDTLPNGLLYMVMELLVGRDLHAELCERGPLPIDEAADLVMQAAIGMSEAHAINVVHRDLKPANLFLCDVEGTPRRLVKVLDFGISRVIHDGGAKLTDDFSTLGTALYMSPEQVRSASYVDARADIWSLGVILYEILTGATPFHGQVTDVLVQVATADIPSPRELRPDLPTELEAVIMRALERDPARRFGSMDELAAALAPWAPPLDPTLSQRLLRPTRASSLRVAARPAPRRYELALLAGLGVVLGLTLIVYLSRSTPASQRPARVESAPQVTLTTRPTAQPGAILGASSPDEPEPQPTTSPVETTTRRPRVTHPKKVRASEPASSTPEPAPEINPRRL